MQPKPQAAAPSKKDKHAAAVAAATLAAQTFNAERVSLFDTARVTGAALKVALQSMVERTLVATRGISPQSTARVIYATSACVQHRWDGNDKQGRRVVNAVIMLPDFDDVSLVPRAFADEMTAYTLHELAHCLFTNPRAFSNGVLILARDHNISQDDAKGIFNAIEDVRIEAALLASGYAAGFRGVIRTLAARNVMEAKARGCMHAFAAGDRTAWGFAFAFGARGYAPGAEGFRAALTPAHQVIYDRTLAAIQALPPNDSATEAVRNIASAALAALKFDADERARTNPGPQPQPQPGDDAAEPSPDMTPEGTPNESPEASDDDAAEAAADLADRDAGDEAAPQPGEGNADAGDDAADDAEAAQDDAQDAQNGPQDDAAADDAAGQGEGNAEAATDAGTPADDAAEPGAGEGTSETSSVAPGAWNEQPAPGAFSDTEMQPRDVPQSCAPQGGIGTQIAPRRIRPSVSAQDANDAQEMLANVTKRFSKSGVLQSSLRRMFSRSDRDALDAGLRHGRIRVAALPRSATGADNIFARRTIADGMNSAVCILLDGSQSMDRRAYMANQTVTLLVKALASCNGVRSQVYAFQEGHSANVLNALTESAMSEIGVTMPYNDIRLSVIKDYDDAPARAYGCLTKQYAAGCTPDLEAVHAVGAELARRPEARKVLICIVDGGSNRDDEMAKEIKALERRGVVTVAVGIQYEPEGYKYAVNVQSLNDLGGAAMRAVCAAVAKDAESRS